MSAKVEPRIRPQTTPQIQEQTYQDNKKVIAKAFELEVDGEHYRYEAVAEAENGFVKRVRLAVRHYPMYPYGNFVEDVIHVEEDESATTITFKFYTVRFNYNGTGSDYHGSVTIDETVLGETPEFLWAETYEDMETPEDFEELIKKIDKFLKDYVSCNIVPR
jgi:hypothetical protein